MSIAAAVLATACGGGGSGTGGGGKTGGGGTSTSTYLLYTDATAATLNVLSISASGTLTVVNTPTQTGVEPIAVATTPDGKFAYVLNANSSTVSQFAITSNGTLTQTASEIGTGLQPTAIAVDPQGRFAVVANTNSGAGGTLSVYNINQTTGVLSAASTTATLLHMDDPKTVTISGNNVYIADANNVDVLVYTPQTGTFAFASGSPFFVGTSTNISALYSPPQASTLLYAADTATNKLLGFTFGTGGLTAAGSQTIGTPPFSLTTGNQNRLLFVANEGSDNISVFAVDATTGALTPATTATLASGAAPNALAYDPLNNFLLISQSGIKQILVQSVNTSTGGLSTLGGALSVANVPSGLAVAQP